MHRYACFLFAAIVLVAIATTTLADGPSRTEAQRAVSDFFAAIGRNDPEQFRQATYAEPGERELVDAGFALNITLVALRDEMVKRFGPSAIEKAKEGVDGHAINLKIPPRDAGWIKELDFTDIDDGQAAKAFNPHTGRDIVVVKDKEGWKVDVFYEQRGKVDPKEAAAALREFAEAYKAGLATCRKEGATLKDVILAVTKKLFPDLNEVDRGEGDAK